MTVNILYGNLPPHLWETISDSVRFITGGLEECGVAVKTGVNQIDRDSVNLFLDRFYMEPNFPLQLKTGGVRYGLICTEVIAPDGTWNYGAEAEDPATVTAFDLAAKYADFVWCLLEESVEACKAINPNSAYLPYGYLPEMETVNRQPNDHRDIDFLMCGIPSERRQLLVDEITAQGHEVYYPGLPIPAHLRDSLMARSRINLSLQKSTRHKIISVTRICHSVINRLPVLLEYEGPETRYTRYCLTASPEVLVEKCGHYLTQTDLDVWAEESYQSLKEDMPMKAIMENLLNESLPDA